MRPTVEEYWRQQLAALKKRSIYPAHGSKGLLADRAGDPHKGIVDVILLFTPEATLHVYERVEVGEDGVVHRTQYSYHLRIGGDGVIRVDYDPHLPPELQYHVQLPLIGGGWSHDPSERTTLVAFAEECWDYVAEHYEPPDD